MEVSTLKKPRKLVTWEQLVNQIDKLIPNYKLNFENKLYSQEAERRLREDRNG